MAVYTTQKCSYSCIIILFLGATLGDLASLSDRMLDTLKRVFYRVNIDDEPLEQVHMIFVSVQYLRIGNINSTQR